MVTTSLPVRLNDAAPAKAVVASSNGTHEGTHGGFTDADISRGSGGVGRELQKWAPDGDGPELDSLTFQSGKLAQKSKSGGWDQFEANERLYGVKTSFNEELYTTKLDKTKSKISYSEADRIAREIEKQGEQRQIQMTSSA